MRGYEPSLPNLTQVYTLLALDKNHWVTRYSSLLERNVMIPVHELEIPLYSEAENKLSPRARFHSPSDIINENDDLIERIFKAPPIFSTDDISFSKQEKRRIINLCKDLKSAEVLIELDQGMYGNLKSKRSYLLQALEFHIGRKVSSERRVFRKHIFTLSEDCWPIHLIKPLPSPLNACVKWYMTDSKRISIGVPPSNIPDCFSIATVLTALYNLQKYGQEFLELDERNYLQNQLRIFQLNNYQILSRFRKNGKGYSRYDTDKLAGEKGCKVTAMALLALKAVHGLSFCSKDYSEISTDLSQEVKEDIEWLRVNASQHFDEYGNYLWADFEKPQFHRDDENERDNRLKVYELNRDFEEEHAKITSTAWGVLAFLAYGISEPTESCCSWLSKHLEVVLPSLEEKYKARSDSARSMALLALRFAYGSKDDLVKRLTKEIENRLETGKDGFVDLHAIHRGGITNFNLTALCLYAVLESGVNYNSRVRNSIIALWKKQKDGVWEEENPPSQAYALLALTKIARPEIAVVLGEKTGDIDLFAHKSIHKKAQQARQEIEPTTSAKIAIGCQSNTFLNIDQMKEKISERLASKKYQCVPTETVKLLGFEAGWEKGVNLLQSCLVVLDIVNQANQSDWQRFVNKVIHLKEKTLHGAILGSLKPSTVSLEAIDTKQIKKHVNFILLVYLKDLEKLDIL